MDGDITEQLPSAIALSNSLKKIGLLLAQPSPEKNVPFHTPISANTNYNVKDYSRQWNHDSVATNVGEPPIISNTIATNVANGVTSVNNPVLSSTTEVVSKNVLRSAAIPRTVIKRTENYFEQYSIVSSSWSEDESNKVVQSAIAPSTLSEEASNKVVQSAIAPSTLCEEASNKVVQSTIAPSTFSTITSTTVNKTIPRRTSGLLENNIPRQLIFSRYPKGIIPQEMFEPRIIQNIPQKKIIKSKPRHKIVSVGVPVDVTILPLTPVANPNSILQKTDNRPTPVPIFNQLSNPNVAQHDRNVMDLLSVVASRMVRREPRRIMYRKRKPSKTILLIPRPSPYATRPPIPLSLPNLPETMNDLGMIQLSLPSLPVNVRNEITWLENENVTEIREFGAPTSETCSFEAVTSQQLDLNEEVVGDGEVNEAPHQEEIKLVNESDDENYVVDVTIPKMFEKVSDHAFYSKIIYDKPKPVEKPVKKFRKIKKKKSQPIGTPQPSAEHHYALPIALPTPPVRRSLVLTCEKCGETFNTSRQKKRHVRIRRHYLGWYCFLCDKKFHKLLNFWSHGCKHKLKNSYSFKNMHDYNVRDGKLVKREYYSRDQKIWQCNVCFQLFFTQKILHNHIVNCTVKCEICRANFTSAEEYRVHITICRLQLRKKFTRDNDEPKEEVDINSCLIHCKYCGKSFTKREVYIFQQHVELCVADGAKKLRLHEAEDSTNPMYKRIRDDDDKVDRQSQLPKLQSPCLLGYCELTSPEIPTIGSTVPENNVKSSESMKLNDDRIVSPKFQPLCVLEKLPTDETPSCRKNLMAGLEESIEENQKFKVEIDNEVLGNSSINSEDTACSLDDWSVSTNSEFNDDENDVLPCSSPPFNFVITDVRGAIDFFSDDENFNFSGSFPAIQEASPKKSNSTRLQDINLDDFGIDIENFESNLLTSKLINQDEDGEPKFEARRRLRRRSKICPRCAHKFPRHSFDDHPCDWLYSHLTSCRVELNDVFRLRRGRSLKITNLDEVLSRHLRDKSLKSQKSTDVDEKELRVDLNVDEKELGVDLNVGEKELGVNLDAGIKKSEFNETETKQSGRKAANLAKRRIRESSKLAGVLDVDVEEEKNKNDKVPDDGLRAKRIKLTENCGEVNENNILESMSDCHLVVRQSRRINHPDWKYKCFTCDKKFFIYKLYAAHLRTHTEQFPYFCKNCGTGFKKECGFKRHKNSARVSGKVKCDDCGQVFCTQNQLIHHADLHNLQKILKTSEIK